MASPVDGKRILLIVGGGIAAYKALELVRLLRGRGAAVRAVLTRAGAEFVTPLSLSALTEDKVYQELFSLTDEAEMGHIQLSRNADLLVVAPATADLMARAANGQAGDLASTVLLATDKPVLMAPAMNVRMWEHPATRRNIERLKADGVAFVGPDEGPMACGEYGYGRLAEPAAILAAIEARLAPAARPLAGRRALVTAGPTVEPLDPVRFLSNHSSGTQGYAIAAALAAQGAETVLVSGPTALYGGTALVAIWLLALASGPAAYGWVAWFFGSWIGRIVLFGYTWALIHHMLGGIKHFVWDLGYGFGPNEREWMTAATLVGSIVLTVVLLIVGYLVMGGIR